MQLRLSSVLALVTAVAALARTPLVAATPAQKLAEARQEFELGNYNQAAPLLNYLLYPTAQLSSRNDLIEAHLLLGLCYLELGNRVDATREIEEALYLDSNLTLDPLVFSEKAIAFVAERKREVEERARRDAEARVDAEARERLRKLLENTIVLERRPYFINFIPMGAGQFQNGQRTKGIILFVSEAALGGLSIGLFAYQLNRYGYNGIVPPGDIAFVNRLQIAQIVSGSLCLAVVAYGIVDSLVYYRSTTRVPADESLIPDEFKKNNPTSAGKTREDRSSLRVTPMVDANSASLVMTWEF